MYLCFAPFHTGLFYVLSEPTETTSWIEVNKLPWEFALYTLHMYSECLQPRPFIFKWTKCIKDEGEVLLVVKNRKVRETKHLWMRMEMGQDTYRQTLCFCWVSSSCYYGNAPYLPAYLPLVHKLQTTHRSSRATGLHLNAPLRLLNRERAWHIKLSLM